MKWKYRWEDILIKLNIPSLRKVREDIATLEGMIDQRDRQINTLRLAIGKLAGMTSTTNDVNPYLHPDKYAENDYAQRIGR